MIRKGWGALALGAALALVGPTAAGADESLEDLKARARSLIQELEREVQKARAERKALENERKALRERPEPAPKTAEAPPPAAEKPAETARKVDVLVDEVERLKSAIVLPEKKELKSIYGLGPAASKVYQQNRGLSIGGYGESFYSRVLQDKNGAKDRADALRFVLYTGYKFSDRILLNTEVEFEHATTGSTVSSSGGEVSVEFAYLDFLGWDYLNLRAGLVLIPMGFINEIHEPVYFHGVQRPEVERTIIPTTWRELGVGAFGSLPFDLQYRTYLTTSLNAKGFNENGIRGGRQSGNRALAETGAGSGRLDWTPSQVPGLLFGGSFFVGETGQNEEFAGEEPTGLLAMGDVHAQYRWQGLELRALYAFGSLGDAAQISRGNEHTVGDRMQGYYLEAAYNLMPLVCPEWADQYVAPFFRYESFDPMESAPYGFTRDRTRETELYTMGITYKPHPQVVLKFDYRNFEQARGERADDLGIGLGFVF
jgi:hypothetical protein